MSIEIMTTRNSKFHDACSIIFVPSYNLVYERNNNSPGEHSEGPTINSDVLSCCQEVEHEENNC